MSIEVNQVDEAISVAFQEASAVETFARRLEDRIGPIPGAKRLLPSRKYGQPLNTKAIRENLSLSSAGRVCGIEGIIRTVQRQGIYCSP